NNTLFSNCKILFFFFFQAEDGIRDFHVTGVQTCALPICLLFEIRMEVRISIRGVMTWKQTKILRLILNMKNLTREHYFQRSYLSVERLYFLSSYFLLYL